MQAAGAAGLSDPGEVLQVADVLESASAKEDGLDAVRR
jgi:hypothetical protein